MNIGPNRLNAYGHGPFGNAANRRFVLSNLEDRDFRGLAAPADDDFDGHGIATVYVD